MRSVWGSRRPRRGPAEPHGPRGADRGSVTAEFATLVPAVLLVLACCLGALQVVGQQVRLTDAAADAARSLSRGDGVDRAAGLVDRAVTGASLTPERQGEFVCARLSAPSSFAPFAAFGLTLQAGSCALGGGQ